MNSLPKVSIIIPVYNVEQFLRECMESVCNQTYKNLEILCVNDGSTDGSLAILQEYAAKDKRIVLIDQQNVGLAATRNHALDIATGDWIGAVDSDDYLDLRTIEKLMEHSHEDVEVIHFGLRWFSDTTVLNDSWADMKFSGKVQITEAVIPQLQPFFCDKLWRRDFMKKCNVRFPVGLHFEDLPFTRCALSMANNIYCLPDKLYNYRRRLGSIMNRHKKRQGGRKILDYLHVSEICLAYWKENNIRERFNCNGPSYLELELLEHIQQNLVRWGADEFQYEAWAGVRGMIDRYDLASRLPEFPNLALYYHLPNYAHPKLREMLPPIPKVSGGSEMLRKKVALLINERKIYWKRKRVQIMALLTCGKRRQKYVEKKRRYRKMLQQCKQLRGEICNMKLI